MKTVALYTRKSKLTQKGESISTQKKLCEEYIRANSGNEEVKIIYYDEGEGVSGGDSQRKKFNELILDAKKKKYDILICYRLDRLAKTGRWLGGTTPTGYASQGYELLQVKEINEKDEVETKVKKAFMLKQIPEEILLIDKIF